MRFLSIYKTPETGTPPTQEEMARMGKLVEDGTKAGFLLAGPRAGERRSPPRASQDGSGDLRCGPLGTGLGISWVQDYSASAFPSGPLDVDKVAGDVDAQLYRNRA